MQLFSGNTIQKNTFLNELNSSNKVLFYDTNLETLELLSNNSVY